MDDERMVCECYDIRVKDLKNAIENGDDTFEKMERSMRLGVLCGACVRDAVKIIKEIKNNMAK